MWKHAAEVVVRRRSPCWMLESAQMREGRRLLRECNRVAVVELQRDLGGGSWRRGGKI